MSKKKNKKKNKHLYYSNSYDSNMYNQTRNEKIADTLEDFYTTFDQLFIITGKSVNEYNDAIEVIKKAVKNLRCGRPDKVFTKKYYENARSYQDTMDESTDD